MMDTEVERKIRAEHTAMIKEISHARDITRDRVLSAYRQMVIDGTDAEAVPVLSRKFDITERVCQNIIDRRGKNNNPKLDVMIEGKMVRHFEGLDGIVHMAVDEMRSQYLDLLKAEDGDKFCTIEIIETTGVNTESKSKGVFDLERKTKKMPIKKAKLELLNEMANAHMKFFGAVNKLMGNTTVNLFQKNEFSDIGFLDMQRRIEAQEKLRGVTPVNQGGTDD